MMSLMHVAVCVLHHCKLYILLAVLMNCFGWSTTLVRLGPRFTLQIDIWRAQKKDFM